MLTNKLHIISFDIPFPANYGGVIDVFCKLKWLHANGIEIYLHCFEYGRKHSTELEKYCKKVFYYKRKTGLLSNLSLLPYTVKSRISDELEKNLININAPILCEVLHTCYVLKNEKLKNRFKVYRHSNIEHEYYQGLAKAEKNILKKIFLLIEAFKLKRFEKIIQNANLILAVNENDAVYFKNKYPVVQTEYLPSFHTNTEVKINLNKSDFVLFHGNLSVAENIEAANCLINNVFLKINCKVIIAGLKPHAYLKALCDKHQHIQLIANPNEEEMIQLINEAQIHVLYTSQPTGLKLKLLNVLFSGKHIICNQNMLLGSGLVNNGSINVCETGAEFIESIQKLLPTNFTESDIKKRQDICHVFNNQANAIKLISLVFKEPKLT